MAKVRMTPTIGVNEGVMAPFYDHVDVVHTSNAAFKTIGKLASMGMEYAATGEAVSDGSPVGNAIKGYFDVQKANAFAEYKIDTRAVQDRTMQDMALAPDADSRAKIAQEGTMRLQELQSNFKYKNSKDVQLYNKQFNNTHDIAIRGSYMKMELNEEVTRTQINIGKTINDPHMTPDMKRKSTDEMVDAQVGLTISEVEAIKIKEANHYSIDADELITGLGASSLRTLNENALNASVNSYAEYSQSVAVAKQAFKYNADQIKSKTNWTNQQRETALKKNAADLKIAERNMLNLHNTAQHNYISQSSGEVSSILEKQERGEVITAEQYANVKKGLQLIDDPKTREALDLKLTKGDVKATQESIQKQFVGIQIAYRQGLMTKEEAMKAGNALFLKNQNKVTATSMRSFSTTLSTLANDNAALKGLKKDEKLKSQSIAASINFVNDYNKSFGDMDDKKHLFYDPKYNKDKMTDEIDSINEDENLTSTEKIAKLAELENKRRKPLIELQTFFSKEVIKFSNENGRIPNKTEMSEMFDKTISKFGKQNHVKKLKQQYQF